MRWQSRNKQFKGCNGKCTFNPFTLDAYSYGHWKFVKVINGKVVFNDYRYSVTTRTHQNAIEALLNQLGVKVDLTVDMRSSLDSFESDALKPMYRELIALEIAMNRKGSKPNLNKQRVENIKSIQKDIKLAKKIGAKLSSESLQNLRESMKLEELQRIENSIVKRKSDSKMNRLSRTILKESFTTPLQSVKPRVIANRYPLDKRERKDSAKLALAAFLNTDTTCAKFGNYYIDGNKLVYRIMVQKTSNLNTECVTELLTGIQNKRVACLGVTIPELVALKLKSEFSNKEVTYRILEENVIAIKDSDTPDGRVNVIGNASKLPLIGRIVAFGNIRYNHWETPIQKELKEIADSYYTFDKDSEVRG